MWYFVYHLYSLRSIYIDVEIFHVGILNQRFFSITVMALEAQKDDKISVVDGIRVPGLFDVDLFRSGLQYKARPDDIFITTYPRSGTHWMSVIVYTLLTNGQPFDKDMGDFLARLPFIDRYGKDVAINMTRPGAIETHYPFDRVPHHPQAKYIGVIRQPKDVCISLYKILTENSAFDLPHLSFDVFFEMFINGQTSYINYFDHIRSLWSHKDDDNVLLISYEQMTNDLRGVIEKVARFLNIDLTADPQLLDRVETYASFDYMKKNYDASRNAYLAQHGPPSEKPINFVRKGIVGDWSSNMTDEQSERLDKIISEKTRDMVGLETFWYPQPNTEKQQEESTK